MLRCFLGKLYAGVLGNFMLRCCGFDQQAVACVCHQEASFIFGKLYVEVFWEALC